MCICNYFHHGSIPSSWDLQALFINQGWSRSFQRDTCALHGPCINCYIVNRYIFTCVTFGCLHHEAALVLYGGVHDLRTYSPPRGICLTVSTCVPVPCIMNTLFSLLMWTYWFICFIFRFNMNMNILCASLYVCIMSYWIPFIRLCHFCTVLKIAS